MLNTAEAELLDPTPDVHALFREFDKRFFHSSLGAVEVRWSPRMTRCAGICVYEGHGGLCSVRLSKPLLKLRPRADLINTLLHEMIHAYLFVTNNNRDRDGHGPTFQAHMHRINAAAGTTITIYHSFTEEVASYQKHWWRCSGPCRNKPPYYGYVKRAMNRAPGPSDSWWKRHVASCGGSYVKVREPEGYSAKKRGKAGRKADKTPRIDSIFTGGDGKRKRSGSDASTAVSRPPSKKGRVGGRAVSSDSICPHCDMTVVGEEAMKAHVADCAVAHQRACPVCGVHMPLGELLTHASRCKRGARAGGSGSGAAAPTGECPFCQLQLPLMRLTAHVASCVSVDGHSGASTPREPKRRRPAVPSPAVPAAAPVAAPVVVPHGADLQPVTPCALCGRIDLTGAALDAHFTVCWQRRQARKTGESKSEVIVLSSDDEEDEGERKSDGGDEGERADSKLLLSSVVRPATREELAARRLAYYERSNKADVHV
eukprot:PLAT14407.1.p1 GENE.PLAT14407.1~~PLAT14407.1.p1  ORF type:complete len:485 (-),score=99.06 PLAT14407.1:9-1463(-)